jgi:hypothetical protein
VQTLSSYLETHPQQIKDTDRALSDLKEFIRLGHRNEQQLAGQENTCAL